MPRCAKATASMSRHGRETRPRPDLLAARRYKSSKTGPGAPFSSSPLHIRATVLSPSATASRF